MTDTITFVCAIEAGRLEAETLLLLQSLRRFGGHFANAPVIAVIGRRGPRLGRLTTDRLAALGVQLVHAAPSLNRYPWFGYSNKIIAINTANEWAGTETIAWLDSDVIIMGEPSGLVLRDDEDIAVRVEPLYRVVTREDTTKAPYWITLCNLLDVNFETMPWLEENGCAQLAYFNSGVFSWRRRSGFAEAYRSAFWRLLDSRIAQQDRAFFSADQVIISPLIAKLGLRWRHLAQQDHHIAFPPLLAKGPSLAGSAVLHYSGSLRGEHRPVLLARLHAEAPEIARWLEAAQAASVGVNTLTALHLGVLRRWRGMRWAQYAARVRPITTS